MAGLATAPVTGADVRRIGVQHSLSLTYRLGQAVLAARFHKSDPVAAALKEGHGRLLFQGSTDRPHQKPASRCLHWVAKHRR